MANDNHKKLEAEFDDVKETAHNLIDLISQNIDSNAKKILLGLTIGKLSIIMGNVKELLKENQDGL